MSKLDKKTYQEVFDLLVKKIKSYNPDADIDMVYKAYKLGVKAHGNQIRKSGEPYMIHPVSVAYILAEFKLDTQTIVAGLLHDVLEDTTYKKTHLEKMFSKEIAYIVDGVTKVQSNKNRSKAILNDMTYKKMYIATSKDSRVILLKLADRLHNMRTLEYMPTEKQVEKAIETLDIYVPILNKLGIDTVKSEIEKLCFDRINPSEYERLMKNINIEKYITPNYVKRVKKDIKNSFNKKSKKYSFFYKQYKKINNHKIFKRKKIIINH